MNIKNVKINNKNYKVKELDFRTCVRLEDDGYAILEIMQKNKLFLLTSMAISAITGCDKEEACRLFEQHIAGGGDMAQITEAFIPALTESAFFKNLLKAEEVKQKENQEENQEMEIVLPEDLKE